MVHEKKIRLLRADEIECRVSMVSEKGAALLLYKDARVDQNILDETFGIYGWKREHLFMGDALFCTVSIRDENGEWVSKQDVGTPSFSEPVKGSASDAFKRACFNWGIGRELYTAPFIWVPAEKVEIHREKERFVTRDRFCVEKIEYDERQNICGLQIVNQKRAVVYSYSQNTGSHSGKAENKNKKPANTDRITPMQEKKLKKEMERTGVSEKQGCERYQVSNIKELSRILCERDLEALEKTKDASAA